MDLLIVNNHQNKNTFDTNIKKIVNYITLNKEEKNGI